MKRQASIAYDNKYSPLTGQVVHTLYTSTVQQANVVVSPSPVKKEIGGAESRKRLWRICNG